MGFTRLDEASAADWAQISMAHMQHFSVAAPLRIMDQLHSLGELQLGFSCDQLQHSLMTATLARRDGADDELVVAALCHDLGKTISVPNHAAIGAEMLKPYVRSETYHAVLHHQEFQGHYYYNHFGWPTNLRERYRDTNWFAIAEQLVDRWDMPAFDPDFTVDPLETFEPEVVRIFSQPAQL